MAKWIYEKWQPKWPEATGQRMEVYATNPVQKLHFDGSLSDTLYGNIATWEVFFYYDVYHQKTDTQYARKYSDKPTPLKDTRLPDVILEEGSVPDDGVHSDQFWYVKVKPAFPTMRILRDGQWAEVETGFVLKDGVWKPIEEIYKLQDGQWVQA